MNVNGGSIFYAYNQAPLELGEQLLKVVGAFVDADRGTLKESDNKRFLEKAACWNPADRAHIESTISTRLGGKDQVTITVKGRLREALGIEARFEEPKNDRQALEQLFIQSDGANWKNKTNWLETGIGIGDWQGVASTGNADTAVVLRLLLMDVGLKGMPCAV